MYFAEMENSRQPGLGELLRHLIDLLDQGSQDAYSAMGIDYRPRYTPIMRAFAGEPMSVSEIQARARITQGAISQTIKLMEVDGLIGRASTLDGRSRTVVLTNTGEALRSILQKHWQDRLEIITDLEEEIGFPLRAILTATISALERDGFAGRLDRRADIA